MPVDLLEAVLSLIRLEVFRRFHRTIRCVFLIGILDGLLLAVVEALHGEVHVYFGLRRLSVRYVRRELGHRPCNFATALVLWSDDLRKLFLLRPLRLPLGSFRLLVR